VNNNN